MLERDFWWPGMYTDVRKWCHQCETCRGERGASGVSAWTRTELYSCPFRTIQIDTVTCREDGARGAKYVLTAVCCFSRWVWLCPLQTRDARSIAEALLVKVMLGMASFPTLIRSDNAKEFTAEIMQQLNAMLDIRHVTSSTYHPQSQGMVESMHKTLNQVVRGLVEDHPEDWEMMLPFAECILRISPMAVLGGRCPYEVVTGLKPRLPAKLAGPGLVVAVEINEYVERLRGYLKGAHASVMRAQTEVVEAAEGTVGGHLSSELWPGDAVLVRREPTRERKGPLRFQQRVYPGVYRVKKRINRHTFVVEDLADSRAELSFVQPVNAERLVKLDLPELDLQEGQLRRIEMRMREGDPWTAYEIDRFAADGRVNLRSLEEGVGGSKWVDLSRCEYRWLV